MAANAYLTANVVVRANNREYSVLSENLPLASPGNIDRRSFDIANGITATIWDAAESLMGAFKWLCLLSDRTVMLELQGTTVGDNSHCTLFAGIPHVLASDATLGYSASSFTGEPQVLKRILVKNTSGSTALVRAIIGERERDEDLGARVITDAGEMVVTDSGMFVVVD